MSTRYSTYFPNSPGKQTMKPNKHAEVESLNSNARSRVLARANDIADSTLVSSEAAIRRPLNDRPPVQPAIAFSPASLKARITARDMMSGCGATLRPDESIERAARLMSETDSCSVPVVDGAGRLIGIITDRDITVKLVAVGASIPHAQVSDCMAGEAFACSADSSLESCVSAMSWHQLKRIPIVDDEHRVVGTISRSDLACYVCEHPQRVEQGAMADILWALAY